MRHIGTKYSLKILSIILLISASLIYFSFTRANNLAALLVSIFFSIILTIIGMVFVLRTMQALVKPIIQLTEAVRDIGKGDLAVKVEVKTGDELEELANSFNQMTADLNNRRQELETLHNSAKALTGNLEINSLINNTLDTIRQIIRASRGSVMLLEGGNLVVKGAFGWKPDEVPREKPFSIGEGVAGWVAEKKESILANNLNDNPIFKKENDRIWRGSRDLLCIPMVYEDKLKGVINIQDKLDGSPFTRNDLEYGEIIASSAALSLINIELVQKELEKIRMEEELKTAQAVQKTILASQEPHIKGVELANFYRPAVETGGDWFGYLQDKQGKRLLIMMGDVSGHGVPSALVTAAVSSFMKTTETMAGKLNSFKEEFKNIRNNHPKLPKEVFHLMEEMLVDPLRPGNILKLLNRVVLDIGRRQLAMTFFVGSLDLHSQIMTFANAGHNPPYLYRRLNENAAGRKKDLGILKASGVRLGDEESVDFQEEKIQLQKKDVLLWFTDGVVECQNQGQEEFGDKRLMDILLGSDDLPAWQIKEKIVAGIHNFINNNSLKDDIAFIVTKIT